MSQVRVLLGELEHLMSPSFAQDEFSAKPIWMLGEVLSSLAEQIEVVPAQHEFSSVAEQ